MSKRSSYGERATRGGAFDTLISVALFITLDRLAGLPWAIAGATVWSLSATFRRHRRGERIGWLLPFTTVYLIVRGSIGIITDSRAVYFGIGIGTKYAIGLGLILSVVAGRGVVRLFAPRVLPLPDDVLAHPIFARTMNRLTIVAGLYEMVSATSDLWLYQHASKGGFLIIRVLVNYVTSFVCLFGSIIYADVRLKHIPGFGGLLELAEATLDKKGKKAEASA